jgi:hypothetical protein
MFNLFKFKKKITFEEQLENLKRVGINVEENITDSMLLEEFSRKEYEKDPYNLLLCALGSEIPLGEDAYINVSNDIYYIDTECIEDHGDYAIIIENIKRISKGTLKLDEIKDFVDVDNEKVWVSFKMNGETIKWNLKADNDWLDTSILSKLSELVRSKNYNEKMAILALDQILFVGFFSEEGLKNINSLLENEKFEFLY